jgi:hypothetical protein
MEPREQRGLEIAATRRLLAKGNLWLVPSSVSKQRYIVDPSEGSGSCTCPDYELRQLPCKRVYAVEYTVRRECPTAGGGTMRETITYREEWSSYNAAQTYEVCSR